MKHFATGTPYVVGGNRGDFGVLAKGLVRREEVGPDVGCIVGLPILGTPRTGDGGLANRSGMVPGEQ